MVIAFLLAWVATSSSSFAAISPLSVGVMPPVQFPPDDYGVTGARFSLLWGNHRDVYGLDIGAIGNITQQDFVGIAVSGIFNHTRGQTTILGLQLAGVTNLNYQKTNVYGIQAALGFNRNVAESSVTGLQLALANLSDHTTVNGFQVGVYNRAKVVNGLQLGVVNVADNLRGLQIGLVNFHHSGLFKISPILNVGF